MGKIIGISGRKQAGKNTLANCMNGIVLKKHGMVSDYGIDDDGQLVIKTTNSNGAEGWGIFDVLRTDEEFCNYAEQNLWPYIKTYHFADYLKKISMDLFDLDYKQVYGTDADKNTDTPYGMTAREFLQYLGTDVMRKIKDTIWVDYTIKLIKYEDSEMAIIPDVRFPNEVEAIHKAGGIVIRLDRDILKSEHQCESSLDKENYDWSNFDHVISNADITVSQLNDYMNNNMSHIL